MKKLMVFAAVLALTLVGNGIASAGWTTDGLNTTTTMDKVGIGTPSVYHSAALDVAGGQIRLVDNNLLTWGGTYCGISGFGTSERSDIKIFTGDALSLIVKEVGTKDLNDDEPYDNGYVGIGTATPASKLHVNGEITIQQGGKIMGGRTDRFIQIGASAGDVWKSYGGVSFVAYDDPGAGVYREVMNIDNDEGDLWVLGSINASDIVVGVDISLVDLEARLSAIEDALNKPGASGISKRDFLNQ